MAPALVQLSDSAPGFGERWPAQELVQLSDSATGLTRLRLGLAQALVQLSDPADAFWRD